MYVGIIWFIFHVLQLLPIRIPLQKHVYHLQIYYETYEKKPDWKSILPWFINGLLEVQVCLLGPPDCVHYSMSSTYKYVKA